MSIEENSRLEFMQSRSPDHKIIPTDTTAISPPIPQERQVNRALFILPACLALIMTGFGIIIPVYPQRLESLGLGAETLALMEGAFGLGMFLFSTPMGVLANRVGRKPLVLLALIGFILTNLMLAFLNGQLLFITVRFLEGIFVAGFMPASMAMIGDAIPQEKLGRWMGVMTTSQAGGIALGPAIGGVLYQSWGFTSPFLLSASFALISSILALIILPETLPTQVRLQAQTYKTERREARGGGAHSPRLVYLAWLFAPLLLIDLGTMFVYPFSVPQYPFFFGNTLHYSPAQYGLIISAFGLTLAVFPLLMGRIGEMLPQKWLIALGCLLSATLNLSMIFLHEYLLLIAAAIIAGIGSALLMPVLSTIYLHATSDENRAQVMGIRSTAISLAMFIAPLTQAAINHWITPQITFAIASTLSIVMALFTIVALKNRH